jgi:hypothetical protein
MTMPLYRLLQNQAFDPAHIEAMAYAFEAACVELRIAGTDDPRREMIAQKVIECAQRGERDPLRLQAMVLADLQVA